MHLLALRACYISNIHPNGTNKGLGTIGLVKGHLTVKAHEGHEKAHGSTVKSLIKLLFTDTQLG